MKLHCGDALAWLRQTQPAPGWLIYLDPPYLRSTRTRLFYRHEFATDDAHRDLLALLLTVPAMNETHRQPGSIDV